MVKKNILIISGTQFGYHIDSYYYCYYLRNKYKLTYIGYDQGLKEITLDRVNIKHIKKGTGKTLYYINECRKEIKRNEIVFLRIHKYSFIFRLLFPLKNMLFDIRTCSVALSSRKRVIDDLILRFNTYFFANISVICDGVKDRLRLKSKKINILPLGGYKFSKKIKNFDKLNLLYVGTLNNRNIVDVIKGYNKFYNDNTNTELYIVGSGVKSEEEKIINLLNRINNPSIHLEGYVAQTKLKFYFDKCNIGIAYIPITEYYNHQPATKLFEYGLSGLFMIATETNENRKYIDENSGLLIKDNPQDFYRAIKIIYEIKDTLDSKQIMEKFESFNWKYIVENNLMNIIEQVK